MSDQGVQVGDQVVEAAESSRRRKQWRQIAVQDVPSEQSLRVAAQTWLKEKKILHRTLTNSSFEKKVVLIARCYSCEACSHQWCFGWSDQGQGCLRVEESGECSEKKHVKRLKRHYAKEFAKEGTPLRALKHMKRENISEALRPSIAQIKNQRHQESIARRLDGYSVECVGDLMNFVNSPPPDVEILNDHVVCTPDRIVVPFTLKTDALDQIWVESNLSTLLMDFTFSTNKEGLLLGGVGPCGLNFSATKGPSMRFLPRYFALSSSEDAESQQLLFNLALARANDLEVLVEDVFADCSCYNAIASACQENGLELRLHRCLEHVAGRVFVGLYVRDNSKKYIFLLCCLWNF